MKIDSTIYNHYPLIRYQKPKEGVSDNCTKERSVGSNVDRGYNSGSSVSFGSAANFSLKALNKLNELCTGNAVVAISLIALFYAAGLRPLAIMSLPGKKDRDDKMYASGHAIASGVIGYVFSSIVMHPFAKGSELIKKEADAITKRIAEAKEKGQKLTPQELVKDLKYLNEKFVKIFCKIKDGKVTKLQKKLFEKTIKILEFAPDTFFFGMIKAMLTIALIPPILKYVFGVEKKSKQTQNNSNTLTQPTYERPKIQNFIGGLK